MLLEQFQSFRELEIPPKQLQMNELLDMFERLEALKNKPSSPNIPPGMEHGELEVVRRGEEIWPYGLMRNLCVQAWKALLKDSAEREQAMKEHLER